MVNITNVAIFITFFTCGKNQLNCVNVLIRMHPTTDQHMGNKPMLVQNFHKNLLLKLLVLCLLGMIFSQTRSIVAAQTTGFVPNVVVSIAGSSRARWHHNVVCLLVGSGPAEWACCALGFSYCRTQV